MSFPEYGKGNQIPVYAAVQESHSWLDSLKCGVVEVDEEFSRLVLIEDTGKQTPHRTYLSTFIS